MKAAIFGYGNLGKGVEKALINQQDVELIGIFTRRKTELSKQSATFPFCDAGDILRYKDQIDVVFNCGGSRSELPKTTPFLASSFHVIDSFDHHAAIKQHYFAVDLAAKKGDRLALISAGWDPGILSVIRVLCSSFLPNSHIHTMWGPGVSQGHSEVIRKIKGVKNAVAYTIPKQDAEEFLLHNPTAKAEDLHKRICYVESEINADQNRIEKEIRSVPDYFYGYNVEVHFVPEGIIQKEHKSLPHAGKVLASDKSNNSFLFSLQTKSNPDFTGEIMTVFGLALWKMAKEGKTGAITPVDIPIGYLLPDNQHEFDLL